jgi:NAD(P)-dependent dehydrogenase (short-subunit alcohol dehydrogenase family)
MLTEQMALEWSAFGIRVNAVAPGVMDAGMARSSNADPEARRKRQSHVPAGRFGTPDDIAEAVLFLASPEADYVTGQTLVVDGGISRSALAGLPRPKAVNNAKTTELP